MDDILRVDVVQCRDDAHSEEFWLAEPTDLVLIEHVLVLTHLVPQVAAV